MTSKLPVSRRALTLALFACLPFAYSAVAVAQEADDYESKGRRTSAGTGGAAAASERARAKREQAAQSQAPKQQAQYPDATRAEPPAKSSSKATAKLKKMISLIDADKGSEVRPLADEVIANTDFNAYDRAFAAQIAAQVAYDADDTPGAMAYLKQAIEFNGLDNNSHFGALLMLAQLQLQEDQFTEALASFDRFFAETKSNKPEHLVLKGNALYRLDRFPEAAAVLKQAIDASPEPKADWLQLLMGTYFEMGNSAEAAKLAESIAAKNPADKRSQMNLAAAYLQGEMFPQAVAVLEKMRAAGQFTEEKDYRQLYATYANMDGKEKEVTSVIKEGLDKGVLKPDFQTYLALGQSYYFSDQMPQAIEAYRKAAPLAPDGETYLNLAKILWQEDRVPEAKEAARQAVAKGVKKPDDARKIIALPGK